MTAPTALRTPVPGRVDRRARVAVAALFLTNGALFANLLPRYPEIKAMLGLGNATYGLAIAAFPTGAIVSGLGAAVLIRRFGSARTAVVGTVLTAFGLLAAGLSPSVTLLAAALFLAGAMDAITDVAQNAHGLRVQRRYRRSIINSFHAVWSVGAVLGGSMAALAIALGLPLGVHLGISAALFSGCSLVALRFCLPGVDEEDGLAPGDDCVGAEDAGVAAGENVGGADAVRATVRRGVPVQRGARAGGARGHRDGGCPGGGLRYVVGLALPVRLPRCPGRVGGERLHRAGRWADRRHRDGAGAAFPSVPGTIAGFAAAGFGVATLVPAAMHEADELPGLRHGTGLTVVSWLMRLGFLLSPPVVGLVADATHLRVGLLIVPLAGLVVVVLAGALSGRTEGSTERSSQRVAGR